MFGNQILDMIFGPWAAYTLFSANRLDIFNRLAEKGKTAEELAAEIGAVPKLLEGLLDACVAMRFLHQNNKIYTNTYISNIYLVQESPFYLGDIIEVMAAERGKWDGLADLVKGKKSAEPEKEAGKTISPHRFTMAMNNLAMLGEANALANAVNLAPCRQIVDVGCGSGLYSIVLCHRFPDLQATLLDTGEVLETTRQMIEKNNLQHRINTREADILVDSYGNQSDVVLLSDVLYQEESSCLAILKNAYNSLAPGGTLLVRGYFSDPGGANPVFGSLFNLAQLLEDPNRHIISVSLISQWVEQAGFRNLNAFPLTEKSTCITALK
jgi:2-polyprenyl-3-methyl-5-hydroxy-6-metoxy-1,4-benzoquinol methylase